MGFGPTTVIVLNGDAGTGAFCELPCSACQSGCEREESMAVDRFGRVKDTSSAI